jgi:hypothetical protein
MPIAQMRRYAELAREGDGTIAERMALLVEHDEQVERTVADLRNQQAHLKQKINWYRTQLPGPEAASER